ncbi:pyruvate kinase [Nitrosospira sp. Nsp18]|uniref:pyruvate kinase n=1 Tax=Nitrosospira sp. Nsp18 TaxID=1855334 RepID=UPI000890AAE0|nr:pyruvate kinase [Nitrosospira sp. Nsp18]SDA21016.1 pyruvate kinase [Nitrosospira sp. Nsp18]
MSPFRKGIGISPARFGKKSAYTDLLQELRKLQQDLLMLEAESAEILQRVDPRHRASAANLVHYLALRRRDMRPLQEKLATVGLSSMGRAESHVLSNLHAIIILLQHALRKKAQQTPASFIASSAPGADLLEINTDRLLGKPPANRRVRIMVTLSCDAADDYTLVKQMLLQGMDCARINCAHDNIDVWKRMIKQIKRARSKTGRSCRILMDLGGPKLRTGEIAPGLPVLKWQPQRDMYGKMTAPARIWICSQNDSFTCPAHACACLPVKGEWLAQVKPLDRLEFRDARGALRSLQLLEKGDKGYWAESTQTTYVKPGLKLYLLRTTRSGVVRRAGHAGEIGALPEMQGTIRLHRGDNLIVTREPIPGRPAQFGEDGQLLCAASIACSLPEIFTSVHPGERILIDDGRIGGVIRNVNIGEILVEITQARDSGEKLLADKGINLPDSHLDLDGVTATDIEHLEFVVRHADMIGLSFVRRAADVALLQAHLKRLDAAKLGVIIKIETRAAFEQLPDLMFTLLRSPIVGVMIARGDLAVECGYERLAELQEEILWLAEAAHIPVIWATQVLEGLAKTGKPSRAEVTDAAMGARAECVMLNKGPYVVKAIQMLDNILQRMQGHQQKKRALLRRLHW